MEKKTKKKNPKHERNTRDELPPCMYTRKFVTLFKSARPTRAKIVDPIQFSGHAPTASRKHYPRSVCVYLRDIIIIFYHSHEYYYYRCRIVAEPNENEN